VQLILNFISLAAKSLLNAHLRSPAGRCALYGF